MLISCLSLHQPWASLVGRGKTVETRGWQPSYRGPLAIHAALKMDAETRRQCLQEPFLEGLKRAGFLSSKGLPLGAVVAVCRLAECIPTEQVYCDPALYTRFQRGNGRLYVPRVEQAFGNYVPGRFAWLLSDIRILDEPIALRGRQRLWKADLPVEAYFADTREAV